MLDVPRHGRQLRSLWKGPTGRAQRQPLEHQDQARAAPEPTARPRHRRWPGTPRTCVHALPTLRQGHQGALLLRGPSITESLPPGFLYEPAARC
jgi:hypothetical protein